MVITNLQSVWYNTFYTPLQIAAAYGVTALAEMLIGRGENVNKRSTPTMVGELPLTPLELAAGPNLDLLKLLLERGADPNSKGNGPTAFHCATWMNPTKECIQLFLDFGANVNDVDDWGFGIMHYFSYRATDPEALRLLLNAGVNINIRDMEGETSLHKLVRPSDLPLDLLKEYLEAEAKVNIKDYDSQSRCRTICMLNQM